MNQKKNRENLEKMMLVILIGALAIVLGIIESMIPIKLPIPGMKLGLANIMIVIGLYYLDVKDMFFVIMFLQLHGSVNTASSKLIVAANADVLIKSTGKAGSEDGAISTAECGQINIFIQRNGAYYIRGYKNEKR